jgi:hypothetical protein
MVQVKYAATYSPEHDLTFPSNHDLLSMPRLIIPSRMTCDDMP